MSMKGIGPGGDSYWRGLSRRRVVDWSRGIAAREFMKGFKISCLLHP